MGFGGTQYRNGGNFHRYVISNQVGQLGNSRFRGILVGKHKALENVEQLLSVYVASKHPMKIAQIESREITVSVVKLPSKEKLSIFTMKLLKGGP